MRGRQALDKKRPRLLPALAATGVMLCGAPVPIAAARGGDAGALASRTISLSESGHLRLTSKHGFTLNEVGAASGTIGGTIYLHLTIASVNRVSAEVSIYPRNGSISGYAAASYHVNGATASFSGSMSIVRGTGSYRHARASRLSFSGTIARSNDAVSVRLSGPMTD
ncbi:MAG TPA: hypothetical protein VK272_01125 [Solirubrobacteraceae bacterium]|nr:hypothetical protein [Solirubrobacteraceae bacterium]